MCKCFTLRLVIYPLPPSSQVHKVFPSGVAAQEGSIKEGEQVLSINGSSLSDVLHWEALRVLRRAKTRNMGVVVLRKGGTSSTPKSSEQRQSPGTTHAQSAERGQRSNHLLRIN